MSDKQLKEMIDVAREDFYSWTPEEIKEGRFRCYHRGSFPWMAEEQCEARAKKPEIFQDDCGASGNTKCPRWVFHRKVFKKESKEIPWSGVRIPRPIKLQEEGAEHGNSEV